MGDLYVHLRMKECCRKTLASLDAMKKGMKGTGAFKLSLSKALSEKPVPDALTALATTIGKSAPEGDAKFASIKKKSLSKAALAHAKEHKARGESTEASLWESLASLFEGKAASAVAGAGALAGAAAGAAGGGAAAGKMKAALKGEEIAKKAQEKVAEYKKAGITYAQSGAAGTADCSHFVHDVLNSSGVKAPYVSTDEIANSSSFKPVTDPMPGDIIWQPGHMGIYTGKDDKGHPLGAQMGTHGAAVGVWGEGGWFKGGKETLYYRPEL
ncbi:MAG: NlpC/P60 family protein [Polyangiaceae bacterium]